MLMASPEGVGLFARNFMWTSIVAILNYSKQRERVGCFVKALQFFEVRCRRIKTGYTQTTTCVRLAMTACILHMQMLKELSEIKRMLQSQRQEEPPTPAHHIVNNQNVMLWAVRDSRAFALNLMDAMFKKEVMADHLCFISAAGRKRMNKETLPTEKVCMHVK